MSVATPGTELASRIALPSLKFLQVLMGLFLDKNVHTKYNISIQFF